ncbi:MAG: hypothetical protein H7838_09660 [Magnetococcus sp. DMHC-8]
MTGLSNVAGWQQHDAHRRIPLRPVWMVFLALLCCWPGQSAWAVSQAEASTPAASPAAAPPAKPGGNKPAAASKDKDKDKDQNVSDKASGIADPAGLLNNLEHRRLELEKRAKWLDLREADLKRLEEKLAKRIASLETLRNEIRTNLDKEKVVDDANIMRLAKILSGMKVKAAADGLKSMDRETAVLVLKVMKEKVAAKILSKMDNEQAAQLANELGIPMAEKKHN